MARTLTTLLLALLLGHGVPAQPPSACLGGQGNASLAFGPAMIGMPFTVTLGASPGVLFSLYVDVQPGNFAVPAFGQVCLGLSPALVPVIDGLAGGFPPMPPGGTTSIVFPLPADPGLLGVVIYAQMITADLGAPNGVGISNPASLQFSLPDWYLATQNSMNNFGKGLHATATFGGGRFVLLAGGGVGSLLSPTADNTVEIYDHYLRTFTTGPPMARARVLHAATRLQDDRILITGGLDGAAPQNWDDAEIYDPATNTWTTVANTMQEPRAGHSATLLDDGRVLIAGGNRVFGVTGTANYIQIFSSGNLTTDIFDPATDLFTPGPNLLDFRLGHEAVKLPDGRVLLTGGINGGINLIITAIPTYNDRAEIYDPVSNTITATGFYNTGKLKPTVALLPSGNVIMAGGASGGTIIASATSEIWNAGTGLWGPGPITPQPFALAGSTPLADGSVAILGGGTGALAVFTAIDQVVRYVESSNTFVLTSPLPAPRINLSADTLPDGTVLAAGGSDNMGVTVNTAWLWTN